MRRAGLHRRYECETKRNIARISVRESEAQVVAAFHPDDAKHTSFLLISEYEIGFAEKRIIFIALVIVDEAAVKKRLTKFSIVQAAIHAWCDFLEHFNCNYLILSAGCLLINCVHDNNQGVI